MKKRFLLFLIFIFATETFGGSNFPFLDKALTLPPFDYGEKGEINVPLNYLSNKSSIVTKWGVFDSEKNDSISILGSENEGFTEGQVLIKTDFSLTKEEIEKLRKQGMTIVGLLTNNAYLAVVEKTSDFPKKYKTLKFSPLLKIEPSLYKSDFPINPILNVLINKDVNPNQFFLKTQEKYPKTEFISFFDGDDKVLRLFYPVASDFREFLTFLAKQKETIFIEPFFLPIPQNDYSVYVIQSYDTSYKTDYSICATIWNHGITGTDETPAVCDTGLDSDMCFYRYSNLPQDVTDAQYPSLPNNGTIDPTKKVIVYNVLPGASAYDGSYTCPSGYHHGTHVCGSVIGDNYLNLSTSNSGGHDNGDGMAPNAKLIFQDAGLENTGCLDGLANDFQLILKQAYTAGARIHSNSWGNSVGSIYDGDSRGADIFTYNNEDFLLFFAAGNSGSSSYTINSPATAKNVVAVGATSNGSEGSNTIASFSSRGPARDGRIKPDVVAPGVNLISASADEIHDSNNCSTRYSSGTSMATPTAAGGATLLREYLRKGFYPTGDLSTNNEINPSAALIKAMLINGAVDISLLTQNSVLNYLYPDNNQGFGRLLLDTVLFFSNPQRDSRGLRIWDKWNSFGLKTGEEDYYDVSITSSSEPLKVTLAWTDPPPCPLSPISLSHDLDLEVISPSGLVYRGNCFDQGSSYPNGAKDSINNVEEVFIVSPEIGNYRIKVKGYYVPYIPPFEKSEKQGYALVATFKDCGETTLSVSNISASDNPSLGIELSWDLSASATSYYIFRAEGDCTNQPSNYRFVGSTNTNFFIDKNVVGGKSYAYKVRPVNYCGEGNFSSCVSLTFTGSCTEKPSFAGVVSAQNNPLNCSIDLNFNDGYSNCPTYPSIVYNIYRANTPYFTPSIQNLLKSGHLSTTYSDTLVVPNRTYYYIVRAEDSSNYGNGPNNNGNEETNNVVKFATTHSNSYLYGTIIDDGGDSRALLKCEYPWKITNEVNHTLSGSFCYHSGEDYQNYPNGVCANLMTEEIYLQPSTSPILSYYANFNIEDGWDGVVVEISNDGGLSWNISIPNEGYGGSFNYSGNSCGIPVTTPAFSGPRGNSSLSGWSYFSHDLSSYAGGSVKIRWRLSSDGAANYEGFYLDDITITNASIYDDCSNSDGSIVLDRSEYSCASTISIYLYDSDLSGIGSANVNVSSDIETTPEVVVLYENPANSGKFFGTISTTTNSPNSDNLISVSEGNLIYVNYIDASDGKGNYNISKIFKAKAKCLPPDEVAKGILAWDIQSFYDDKATQIWPEVEGAYKYRLYRGTLNDLPKLLNGEIDSCLVYEGVLPKFLCPENPALINGKLYFYLVTALNVAGEGSAGNATGGERIVNSINCP